MEDNSVAETVVVDARYIDAAKESVKRILPMLRSAKRPVFLIGGGITREKAVHVRRALEAADVCVMTTWNGMDRVDARSRNYGGRPNQWGQRFANILIQQADVLVALGTRLGMQQTGFNWSEFAPLATVIQVDIDEAELHKGHPRVDLPIVADANTVLQELLLEDLGRREVWLEFVDYVKGALPLDEPQNETAVGYIDPYKFAIDLSAACDANDVVIPCSSGGAYTTIMQAFSQKGGQIVINNKGLAAMGYGLSSAIGAAFAQRDRRTILVEGDGGFSQNCQELATVGVNGLRMKMFVYSNEGYASIRMTQRNYFGGDYLGCDIRTGLGFPDWPKLFDAFSIPVLTLGPEGLLTEGFDELFLSEGPAAFVVPLDPDQTYFPKIASRVTESGSMESAPLHLMTPELSGEMARSVMRFLAEPAALGRV
jgi:acetolactate synthase-1/2/3 large subunit